MDAKIYLSRLTNKRNRAKDDEKLLFNIENQECYFNDQENNPEITKPQQEN